MGTLVPTPVTLEDLINKDSDINAFNDGVKTQAVSPRTQGEQWVTVAVTDDPWVAGSYWTQKTATGEWVREDKLLNTVKSYTLPVNTAVKLVHMVVYPWDMADIANYPTK